VLLYTRSLCAKLMLMFIVGVKVINIGGCAGELLHWSLFLSAVEKGSASSWERSLVQCPSGTPGDVLTFKDQPIESL